MVKEKAVLLEETVNMPREALETYDVLEEIYIIALVKKYVDLLIKADTRVIENEEHLLTIHIVKIVYGQRPLTRRGNYLTCYISTITGYGNLQYK